MANDTASLFSSLFGGNNTTSGTNDINEFQKILAANDVYRQAANPILNAKFDTSTWSPGTTVGVTALQSFLGGALNLLGQRDEGQQVNAVSNILPQLYKDPTSVGIPDGVDPEAFGVIKLAAESQRQKTDEAIRQALGEKFFSTNKDGSISATPGATDAISQIFTAETNAKKKQEKGSPANQATVKDIAGTIAALDALNANDSKIKNLEGASVPGLGGILSYGASMIPGTNAYNYQKALPFLADPLTVGLSGSSKQGILNKTLDSLAIGPGQPSSSMLDVSNQARQAMVDKGLARLETLKEAGYTTDELEPIRQKLIAASQVGVSQPALGGNSGAPDIASFIAQAKAAGLTKEEARQKWLQMGGQ